MHPLPRPSRPAPRPAPRDASRLRTLLLPLALLAALPASAADLFVLEATVERPDGDVLNPTFMATPGERALMMFDGDPRLDVAVTVRPADAAAATADASEGDAFEVRVELIEGGRFAAETVRATLGEPATVSLEGGEVTLRLRERPGLEPGPDDPDRPVISDPPTGVEGSGGASGAGGTGDAGGGESG